MVNSPRFCLLFVSFHAMVFGASCFVQSHQRRSFRSAFTSYHISELKATAKPSIGIVGSGAVGGYYGARLWESGAYDVKFFMRGDHYEESKSNGLNVTSVCGDIFIPPDELQVFSDTNEMGTVDWVIVAIKSTALDSIPALISPLLEPGHTRVLAIMNGLIEDDLVDQLKKYQGENVDDQHIRCCGAVYGGMALVCSNRLGPGRIDHTYAGLLSSGVAVHSQAVTMEENRVAFENLWEPVQIETVYEPSLLGGRWRKVNTDS
jgi:2-dehydropantoate 2-reductase